MKTVDTDSTINGEPTSVDPRLKVLVVSLYHPELIRGGAQQVAYELYQGLAATEGIDATLLASADQRWPSLFKSGARITGFDQRPGEYLFLSREYDHWWHRSGNVELVERYCQFLAETKPDVVHFHHFLTLGIDLLSATRRVLPDAKIVFTFHEFLSICNANGQMVRTFDRSLCATASAVRCHQCFPNHSPETFFMRENWLKVHFGAVDRFTVPSAFMIDFYARWGIPRQKLEHVTNGQRLPTPEPEAEPVAPGPRKRFGFFGQLVDNKGVQVIFEAVTRLRMAGFTDFVVEINGDNLVYATPEFRKRFEDFMAEEEARPMEERNVFLNGPYSHDELPRRMKRVDWCIVPSVWWEIFGLVISEAWAFGKPVIASDVGGMAERIGHDRDGLLFAVGDGRALAETMQRAVTEEGLWSKLRAGIRAPATREDMTAAMLRVYRGVGAAESAAQHSTATLGG
ncbi:MAG: glycosyltransferase family 4 protein [Bauldia sp.]|nr:glycosyltransferase family 4 protein [Bauldia sp.]